MSSLNEKLTLVTLKGLLIFIFFIFLNVLLGSLNLIQINNAWIYIFIIFLFYF